MVSDRLASLRYFDKFSTGGLSTSDPRQSLRSPHSAGAGEPISPQICLVSTPTCERVVRESPEVCRGRSHSERLAPVE